MPTCNANVCKRSKRVCSQCLERVCAHRAKNWHEDDTALWCARCVRDTRWVADNGKIKKLANEPRR